MGNSVIFQSMKSVLVIGLGGAIGSELRYGTQLFVHKLYPFAFPMGTFLVNIIGCFCIGVFYALSEKGNILTPDWRLFLITGLCGGYTTFSTFAYENVNLLRTGDYLYFGLYTMGSVVLGLLAVFLGIILIKSL